MDNDKHDNISEAIEPKYHPQNCWRDRAQVRFIRNLLLQSMFDNFGCSILLVPLFELVVKDSSQSHSWKRQDSFPSDIKVKQGHKKIPGLTRAYQF